ncbi:MAG TPA: hypothetical protein VGK00_06205 [Anaerolineales bacterium]
MSVKKVNVVAIYMRDHEKKDFSELCLRLNRNRSDTVRLLVQEAVQIMRTKPATNLFITNSQPATEQPQK